MIVPYAFLELRPEGHQGAPAGTTQNWLTGHARQLIAAVALIIGAYMVITAIVRLVLIS